jgi:CelD/BcsL family acetyltransferase involved in cellulose biosynthesis
MVDAIAIGLKGHNLRVSATGVTAQIPSFNATVHATAENYLAQCAELDLCGPAQSALWISAWLETTCPNAILVTVDFGGRLSLGWPFRRNAANRSRLRTCWDFHTRTGISSP